MQKPKKIHFTVTQRKILELLGDGEPHTREELHSCCGPEFTSEKTTVAAHLCYLRKKLKVTSTNGTYIDILPARKGTNSYVLVEIRPATLNKIKSF